MKIDLHVHARERSDCATSGEEDQIQAAVAAGLDGIAFTDHQRLVPPQRLAELNFKFNPFKIFTGIEIWAEQEDWLVFGMHDPRLEERDWHYADLCHFVQDAGGFIALAHPFRFAVNIRVDISGCPPDGIEISSVNTPQQQAGEIRAIASRLGLALLKNSDAHNTGMIGSYFNEFPAPISNDAALLSALNSMRSTP